MTIPTASDYPTCFDTDTNLYVVHDNLRMTLAEDYNAGDTSITVVGDETIMSMFPDTGIITLTDQCDEDPTKRAISFFYGSKTDYTFDDLELLPEFEDMVKPKNFTHVTLNVVSPHHVNLKNALIAIEDFVGVKGTIDTQPLGNTLEGRVNFLRKLVFTPRAWFGIDGPTIGIIPLEVTFKDESTRLGSGSVVYLWDFGDNTCSIISTISVTPVISVIDMAGGTVAHTYTCPGKFDVSLKVSNEFGEDTVVFSDIITARIESPDEAVIDYIPIVGQNTTSGEPTGGPYVVPPTIRSKVDTFIDVEVPDGINPATGKTYAGEVVNGHGTPLDPVTAYTWSMGDDLTHHNNNNTRAMYSIGGIYDLVLRVDTSFGAYRITKYSDSIDIIETTNLWMWTFDNLISGTDPLDYLQLSGDVTASEFGLISETFKTASNNTYIYRNDAFLESDEWEEIDTPSNPIIDHAKKEFRRNVAFTSRGTATSGNAGSCMLYYSTGGTKNSSLGDQSIKVLEHNGFNNTYSLGHSSITRPWNWTCLGGLTKSYFIMGQNLTALPYTNPSYQVKTTYELETYTTSNTSLTMDNYLNGANELMQHVSSYDPTTGNPTNGWFAVYRSAWKNSTGFFVRNDGVGNFFRLKSFYKTEGVTLGEEFVNIKKLPDMEGPTKLEGQLVPLTNGVFFFNNSGNISAYNDTTGTWETGGPGVDSIAFSTIQDSTVADFNNASNTLLAASDNDYVAYLSYDYSRSSFVKFNGQDLTFNILTTRPRGSQFSMGVY